MKTMKCPMCAGTLTFNEKDNCYICDFCDTPVAVSGIDDQKVAQLKERANKLFLSCDFDGATALYQSVVSEVTDDAESYWLLALCAYGIQYVDDPLTKKKIPTCHRTSYSSILNNEDYLNALDCADVITRSAYQEAAKRIDEIQRGILSIVSKESPYDVFICYKETTEDGMKTKESDIAKDLYYKLIAEGYRTFYAPITLQEKAGMEYEPFIFSALNSAKIMFVIGFSKEHYEAVWVKNEWSRFLTRKARNPRLLLVSCYNSFVMNAAELPEQLSKTQARDLANASTNDLVNDVKKWIPKRVEATEKANVDVTNLMGGNAVSLLKRGYIYLEDREFKEAIDCFNKSLDLNPELSRSYWGLILSKYRCRNNAELSQLGKPIHELNEYKKAIRFANDIESEEYHTVLSNIDNKIKETIESLKQCRNAQVYETGVKGELTTGQEHIQKFEEEFNNLISQLNDVEEQIKKYVVECKNAIAPQYEKIVNITSEANGILNETKKKKLVDDSERSTILSTIKLNRKTIEGLAFEEAEQTKRESDCFAKLNELLKTQSDLVQALAAVSNKTLTQTEEFSKMCKKVQEVERKFAPSFKQVPTGDYRLSSQLLGIKRDDRIDDTGKAYIGNIEVTNQQMGSIEDAIRDGNYLEAIKITRSLSGLGLAEARTFVDSFEGIDKTKPNMLF